MLINGLWCQGPTSSEANWLLPGVSLAPLWLFIRLLIRIIIRILIRTLIRIPIRVLVRIIIRILMRSLMKSHKRSQGNAREQPVGR